MPFTSLPIRYERAYGGRDEHSVADIPFHYPRNPMGTGVVLRDAAMWWTDSLPNVEDPDDLLTPERVIMEAPERWPLQPPLPAGFGWRQRNWFPRSGAPGRASALCSTPAP